jgi:RimJ/RimL family protein N-acetyltransferase
MRSRSTNEATRDGRTIVIRPLEPGDKPLLVEGLKRMSEESRYRRFLAPKPSFTAAELAYLTEVDHHDHEALIAIEPESGDPVGVARYVRDPVQQHVAEAALAVVDEWQHRGVGTALLRHLIARARQEDVRRFRASVLSDNQPMLRLLDQPGLQPTGLESPGPGVQAAEFDLIPESGWRQLLDALRAAARGDLTFRMPHLPSRSRSNEEA